MEKYIEVMTAVTYTGGAILAFLFIVFIVFTLIDVKGEIKNSAHSNEDSR